MKKNNILTNLLNAFSGSTSIKDKPEPFIIAFLARKLGYNPASLADLFENPMDKLNIKNDKDELVNFWNDTIEERIKLKKVGGANNKLKQ